MESVGKVATCDKCGNLLDSPIILPCFKVICESHLNELFNDDKKSQIKCFSCKDYHQLPENGFDQGVKVKGIIDSGAHFNELVKINNLIESYENILDDFKKDKQNLNFLLYDKINDIKNKIDLDVERLKLKIDNIRDDLFSKLKKHENECLESISKLNSADYNLKLNEIKSQWDKDKNSPTFNSTRCKDLKQSLKDSLNEIKTSSKHIETVKANILKIDFESKSCNFKTDLFGNLTTKSSTDNSNIIIGSFMNPIRIWKADSNSFKSIDDQAFKNTACLAISNDENLLTNGTDEGDVTFWDINNSFTCLKNIKLASGIFSLAITPRNELITGLHNGDIQIWNLNSYECIKTYIEHTMTVWSILIYDEARFISCSSDKRIKIWNIHEINSMKTMLNDSEMHCQALKNKNLITGCENGYIKIWNIESGYCSEKWKGHDSLIFSLVLTERNEMITGDNEGLVKIWVDIDNVKTCIKVLDSHLMLITSLRIPKNGKHLISTSMDGYVIFWDLDSFEFYKKFKGDEISCSLVF